MRRLRKLLFSTVFILGIALLSGCGGGGGSVPPPPPQVSVSVSPSNSTVTIPTPQTFTATVLNATNTTVNWSIQEGTTGGSISGQGVYTPPSDHTGTYHVVATAQADSTKSGTATVAVVAPAPVISTTPSSSAAQGVTYTYAAAATDAAGSGVTFLLTSAPTGATLTGNTVTWTPDPTQARQANSFSLKATTGLGMSATQNWTVTPTGDVTVDIVTTYYLESGRSSVTITQVLTAYVPNTSGGFDTVQSDSNGTFANMPAGYFWLDYGGALYWTKASHVDLRGDFQGRPDAVWPSSQVLITYNVSGLNPTTTADWIEEFSWDALSSWSRLLSQIPAGSTAASLTMPWNGALPDASKGDKTYFSQASPVGDGTFRVITASTGGLPLTLSGSNETIDITMTATGLNSNFRAKVNDSEFAALVPGLGSNATDSGAKVFEVDAGPGSWQIAYLAKYTGPAITADQDFGDVSFGDPYPSDWNRAIVFQHNARIAIQVDGKNFTLSPSVYYASKNLPTADAPIRPVVGPVGNPKINNLALTTPQTGVGLNPTITWTAPAFGKADYYWVDLVGVSAPFSTLTVDFVNTFITKTTSITLPTGLQAGKTYVVWIHAFYDPSTDPETGATTGITTLGETDFYSATFTP